MRGGVGRGDGLHGLFGCEAWHTTRHEDRSRGNTFGEGKKKGAWVGRGCGPPKGSVAGGHQTKGSGSRPWLCLSLNRQALARLAWQSGTRCPYLNRPMGVGGCDEA
ncbi:hypothetical protein BHM03_00047350 [Ensete ventricosum]|nr:hypothetical protein BHM03_00047350 [Ensete ventricosum]